MRIWDAPLLAETWTDGAVHACEDLEHVTFLIGLPSAFDMAPCQNALGTSCQTVRCRQ